ncbi:NUDIX hydrolase [Arsenicicoccus dermatophilus]|uniref:NUDIX hydrolase n=1 Tax=Arsenicicoccus dermatophilus TaxID=1076331 RepID=UPI001F4CE565|nr:NUDIX hydrolase [Arsenicicoccus dermatophilus]MCH8613892.1 NUDIX hydrolase [Arsenicicoccus dermatophilus]
MHFTEYDTRLAAYALIVDGDRVLLTWFNGQGGRQPCWTLPGGGVELDESCEQAVVRECQEETGHTVELGRPLTTTHRVWREVGARPYKAVRVVFEARITGGVLGVQEVGGTTDRAEWFALAEVSALEPRADSVDAALAAWRRHGSAPTGSAPTGSAPVS